MAKLRLDERLLYTTAPQLTAGQSNDSLIKKSIIDHLARLLNTRKGSVPIDPDFGLSDMSNIAGSFAQGTTQTICEEVVQQISRYEPRLKDPKVATRLQDQEREVITLRFDITGSLVQSSGQTGKDVLNLIMRINSHGFVKLTAS